jgi:hypothetical protein
LAIENARNDRVGVMVCETTYQRDRVLVGAYWRPAAGWQVDMSWGGRRPGAGRKLTGTAMTGQERTRRWRQKRQSPFQADVNRLETAMEKTGSDLGLRARRPAVLVAKAE